MRLGIVIDLDKVIYLFAVESIRFVFAVKIEVDIDVVLAIAPNFSFRFDSASATVAHYYINR